MTTMLLSEAIDRGLADPSFSEQSSAYLSRDFERPDDTSAVCGCAGGAALVGAGFTVADFYAADANAFSSAATIGTMLGISREVVKEISYQHASGTTASKIANWVRREHPDLLVQVVGEVPS